MIAQIRLLDLALMLPALVLLGYFMHKWGMGVKNLIIATCRMVVQLIAIGYCLIYIFNNSQPLLVIFIFLFMLLVSGWITLKQTKNKRQQIFLNILISLSISCSLMLFLVILVIRLEPWYESRYIVPLAGMIVANAMNTLSLFIERLESELAHTKEYNKARNIAFSASLIPQINALLAVGLVSLPGMMSGQILSGVSPLVAVRYQIIIMVVSICGGGFASIVYGTIASKYKTQISKK